MVLDDPERDLFVEAEHWPIGIVFQMYLLSAHLSVRENVAFGLRSHGVRAASAHRSAAAGGGLASPTAGGQSAPHIPQGVGLGWYQPEEVR